MAKIASSILAEPTSYSPNGDFNPNVTRIAPLHEDGMGLRSTSMGDEMIVDGKTFKVAMLGFEEVV